MARNTGRGSSAAQRDPMYGRFTEIKTDGGSFRTRTHGTHHRPLTKADRQAINRAFLYWFLVVLLSIAILAGLVILVAP